MSRAGGHPRAQRGPPGVWGGAGVPAREKSVDRGQNARATLAGDAAFQVGFEHPDWFNGFEHDPEEAACVRVAPLRELAASRESLVATHLSLPSCLPCGD